MLQIRFTDNPVARKDPGSYLEVRVAAARVLAGYRASLYSFEWLTPDGQVRDLESLPPAEREEARRVQARLEQGEALEKPVLGVGLLDAVEFGAGRAEFLMLVRAGLAEIPVHIRKNQKEDFQPFLAGVE